MISGLLHVLESASPARRNLAAAGALLVLVLAAYSNSLHAQFHFDDAHQLVKNQHIRDIGNLPRFFVDGGLGSVDESTRGYRPVTYASFALNYAVSGYRVEGYHLFNIALHFVNALMVYLLVAGVLREGGRAGPHFPAFAAALLFALHPVQTGAVTYISGRAAMLAALFTLMAFMAFMRHRRDGARRLVWAAASVAFFCLGLLAKEMAVALIALMAAYDALFTLPRAGGRRAAPKAALSYVPYLAALGGYLAAKKALQGFSMTPEKAYGVGQYLMSESKALLMYIRLLVLPVNQNADYNLAPTVSPDWRVALSALMVASAAAFLYRRRRSDPAAAFFGSWFLLALAPESSLVPIQDIAVEYRLYLPSVGFVAAAVLIVSGTLGRRPALIRGLAALTAAAFMTLALGRNAVWATEYSLWSDVAGKSPLSARAHASLGGALMDERRYADAVKEFDRALKLAPLDGQTSNTYNNLGICYSALGMGPEAASMFEKVLEFDPRNREAYVNLGVLYLDMGHYQDSVDVLTRAVKTFPEFTDAHADLSRTYLKLGRIREALSEMEEAYRYAPMDFGTNLGLAELYMDNGMRDKALSQARTALRLAGGAEQEAEAGRLLSELGREGDR